MTATRSWSRTWASGRRMMTRKLPIALTALGLLAAPPSWARPPSLEGKWVFNAAESELLPGEPPPAELVMTITRDDGIGFRWTVVIKMPDGGSGSTIFDGAIDGKPHPVQGRPGSASAFSWTPAAP